MKYMCLVLMFLMSSGLWAFHVDFITKDDKNFKKLKMSNELTTKAGDEGKSVVTIKMIAQLDHSMDVDSYLVNNGKRTEVKPVIKDNIATIILEVNKDDLEKAELHFSYQNGAGCPPMYAIKLSELIAKSGEVKK